MESCEKKILYYESKSKEEILELIRSIHELGVELISPNLKSHNYALYRAISRPKDKTPTKPFSSIIKLRKEVAKLYEKEGELEQAKEIQNTGITNKTKLSKKQILKQLEVICKNGESLYISHIESTYPHLITAMFYNEKKLFESMQDARNNLKKKFSKKRKKNLVKIVESYDVPEKKDFNDHWTILKEYVRNAASLEGLAVHLHNTYQFLREHIGNKDALLERAKKEFEKEKDTKSIEKIKNYYETKKIKSDPKRPQQLYYQKKEAIKNINEITSEEGKTIIRESPEWVDIRIIAKHENTPKDNAMLKYLPKFCDNAIQIKKGKITNYYLRRSIAKSLMGDWDVTHLIKSVAKTKEEYLDIEKKTESIDFSTIHSYANLEAAFYQILDGNNNNNNNNT